MCVAAICALVAAPAAAEEPSWFVPEGERPKNIAVEGNPLAIAIGRFSATIEYMVAPHHAITLSPHYYFALPGTADLIDGPGVEAGYRWYSRTGGPFGWFVGASALFGAYRYRHTADTVYNDPACAGATPPGNCVVLDGSVDNAFDSIGAAIDAGYQLVVQERILLAGGLGAQYTFFTKSPGFEFASHPRHDLFYGPGFRPRLLLAAGAAF